MIPFLYAMTISLIIALPVVLAAVWRRRAGPHWWLFCVGMATFVVSQAYHLPLNAWLTDVGVLRQITPAAPATLRLALLLGLSAGLCESLARAAGYAVLFRWARPRHRPARWADAVMVGLGHGGIEALLLAVVAAAQVTSLWSLRETDLSALSLPADHLSIVQQQLTLFLTAPDRAFAPLAERAIAILIHVSLSVLVWTAFRRRRPGYFAAAVACHTLFDGLAVYMAQRVQNVWAVEGLLLLATAPVAAWAYLLRDAERAPEASTPWLRELALFGAALRHELRQQWATRRALVIGVVFVVFGMGSPLLAYFTPQILSSFEGAEMFAELIPTPSVADALGQYIKNLTQFGFILAVLLGMGAVAGEKERGTAALIMSKPLPRWAFVLAKFAAQAIVYAAAFALAALGAWYYTDVLFEPLALGPFILGNLLLWAWMLSFAAVTLVGSVIARSTGAAAGIGFGGSVALLLSGYLPRVGPLTPAALVTWAGQLGLSAPLQANGGALAGAVVWIVVCLITAVAVFEVQEL